MEPSILRNYARLIARQGANVQPGQEVFIEAGLDQPAFVRMLAEECYALGARRVVVDWADQGMARVQANCCPEEAMAEVTDYEEARLRHQMERLSCRIYLESDDPDGLAGVDTAKLARVRQARYPIVKPYRDAVENKIQWCIAAVPGEAWAKKLFPEWPAEQAVERLWEAILAASRAMDDPLAAWEAHDAALAERCAALNALGIESLHYTAGNGTDLTVGMIPQAEFKGGGERTLSGVFFNPNIPTEECFITPMRGQAEGVVYSALPLIYEGQRIDRFMIRFREGRAVEWHAEEGEELLGHIITMDEGSGYLGECALVPYDSPIRNTGLLFYNTLFDENAACHLALGMGFADTIRGFETMTLEECRALGVNDSMMHVDFMIGTRDMDITAHTRDGRDVPIFRQGQWAF